LGSPQALLVTLHGQVAISFMGQLSRKASSAGYQPATRLIPERIFDENHVVHRGNKPAGLL
jgi:hypothetical protein